MPLHGLDNVHKAIQEKIEERNDQLRANYTMALTDMVVGGYGGRGTPVHFKDGGRTRNGWFLSVGSPSFRTTVIEGGKSAPSSMAQIASMPKNVLGKKIYFTNSSPAILFLEYGGYPKPPKRGTYTGGGDDGYQILSINGYSRQAPNGMARFALTKLQNRIKRL